MANELLIARVFSYNNDKGTAYLELFGDLKAGQVLHFQDPDGDFLLTVNDITVDNQNLHFAERGDYIAIHVPQKVHQDDNVFMRY